MSVPPFVRRALVWVLVTLIAAAGPLAGGADAQEGDPTVSVDDVTVAEGAYFVDIPVRLSEVADHDVEVELTTRDGTAVNLDDYYGLGLTLVIPRGSVQGTVRTRVLDDREDEGAETFLLDVLTATGAVIGDGSGTVTIEDDDPGPATPVAYVGHSELPEQERELRFPITLSEPAPRKVLIEYSITGGTGDVGADVSSAGGVVEIREGEESGVIVVGVIDDSIAEPDETVELTLTATHASLPWDTVTGTILDDDPSPPDVSVADVEVFEDEGEITFTISLSEPATEPVTVDYTTADSTSPNGAKHGRDFVMTSGTATFEPGATSVAVSVPLVDDLVPELTESFRFLLEASAGGVIVDRRANGTIGDDDPIRLASVL